MADTTSKDEIAGQEPFQAFFDMQGEAMREMLGAWLPGAKETPTAGESVSAPAEMAEWARSASEIQSLWLDFLGEQARNRSEEHTSELQSLMRNSYAVFCLNKKTYNVITPTKKKTHINTYN